MKCNICSNKSNNTPYILKEMMFGLRDTFEYFQCGNCSCIQIKDVPENMDKYYPENYYSFSGINKEIKKLGFFKQLQYDYLTGNKKTILGAIASFKYHSDQYDWCNWLELKDKNLKILDVGCGNGELLKQLYQLGFKNLIGADPYIDADIAYNENLYIHKKSVFDLQEKYDVIMLHHSLEHMENQSEVIDRLYQILNENGKLFIRIPVVSEPLFQKYREDLVNLDAPRHFFIHSLKSINYLLHNSHFNVLKTIFDSKAFDIIASEQYKQDIPLFDEKRSYVVNRKNTTFSSSQIREFKKQMFDLNAQGEGSSVALVIEKK